MKSKTLWTYLLGIMLAFVLLGGSIFAADVVKTNDGKTYEGKIVTENSDYLEIIVRKGSIEMTLVIMIGDIASIVYDGETAAGADPVKEHSEVIDVKGDTSGAAAQSVANQAVSTITADVASVGGASDLNKRVFVIPLEGMVGQYFRADQLKKAVDAARPYDPDVIVLRINSGGGLLLEIPKLVEYLQEIREEFRVVVWIESAISAAAMTAFNVREMYFTEGGHIGAATAFNPGTGKAIEGRGLEIWLEQAHDLFASAGWDPKIAKAMIEEKHYLTADIEIRDNGEKIVTWHDDDSGEYKLSAPGENLVMDSDQALKFGIAMAVCDNENELAEALGLEGWVEVSDAGRKIMRNWKNKLDRIERDMQEAMLKYNRAENINDPRTQLGIQAQVLRTIVRIGKSVPRDVFEIFYGGGRTVRDYERELKIVLTRLAQLDR